MRALTKLFQTPMANNCSPVAQCSNSTRHFEVKSTISLISVPFKFGLTNPLPVKNLWYIDLFLRPLSTVRCMQKSARNHPPAWCRLLWFFHNSWPYKDMLISDMCSQTDAKMRKTKAIKICPEHPQVPRQLNHFKTGRRPWVNVIKASPSPSS